MAKRNFKYNSIIDLNEVKKRDNGNYDWKTSIGCIIPFTFDDKKLTGKFKLIDYKVPEGLTNNHVYLEYMGNVLQPIVPYNLKNGKISNIIDEYYIEWEYEIGQRLVDEKRDITIIDRFRRKGKNGYLYKYYKIKCNICGFDSSEHYCDGEYREEWIVTENDLKRQDKRRVNCPSCNNRIVVPGINDIPTTDPWMISYFQGGYDEAKKYSYGSNVKKFFKCIFCNQISLKEFSINRLYKSKGIPCACLDHMSYPNKFAYYTFKQLNKYYDFYCNEYIPSWAGLYRYDNYVEIADKRIVFEMDGGIGHGNYQYMSKNIDTEGLKRDKIKDELANQHNLIVERIDCLYSEYYYIQPRFEKALSKYFNTQDIDWSLVEANCRNNNLYKEICFYFNDNKNLYQYELAKVFNVGRKTIMSALKTGNKFGWCNYIPCNKTDDKIYDKIIDLWNTKKYTLNQIAKNVNKASTTVTRVIKDAACNGLCEYDNEIGQRIYHKSREKHIYVYNKNMELLNDYDNAKQCSECSDNDFGVHFTQRSICSVASHTTKSHRGYIFSYELLNDNNSSVYLNKRNSTLKKVYVYDLNMNFCGVYKSRKELTEKSVEDFGVQFVSANISMVCVGKYKHHKGYYFSNEPLHKIA